MTCKLHLHRCRSLSCSREVSIRSQHLKCNVQFVRGCVGLVAIFQEPWFVSSSCICRYVHEGGRHPSVGLQAHVSRSMAWCTCRMVPVSQVRVRCSQDFFAQLGFQVVQEQLLAVCSIPGLIHGRAHKPSAPRLDRERARAIFQSTWRAGKCIFTSPHILSPIPPGSGRGSVKALLCETRGPSRGP